MSRRDLVSTFWIWIDCVALTIGGVGSIRGFRRVRLVEEESDTFKVQLASGAKTASAPAEKIRIADRRVVRPLSQQSATLLRGSHTELILRPDRFLLRPLDLPKRAGEFLEGIIRSQIDRLTPWSVADAAFGWTAPAEVANQRIALTVVATARTFLSPYVEALSDVGAKIIVVSTAIGATDDVPVEILRQRGTGVFDNDKFRRGLAGVLLLALLSMVLAVAADQIFSADLDRQKNDILRSVAAHRSAARGEGLSTIQTSESVLERRKHEMPSSVIVLEALSQILPDHTYASELRIEGDKLQVVGVTRDAPSLIRLIEQSPHFTRATFYAPTTRSPNDPGERFHIEARIMPAFTVQR